VLYHDSIDYKELPLNSLTAAVEVVLPVLFHLILSRYCRFMKTSLRGVNPPLSCFAVFLSRFWEGVLPLVFVSTLFILLLCFRFFKLFCIVCCVRVLFLRTHCLLTLSLPPRYPLIR
jgi:hypothetical protein